jgi:hypothetical protein
MRLYLFVIDRAPQAVQKAPHRVTSLRLEQADAGFRVPITYLDMAI